ncbi:MAG: hypothetical protein ACR2MD_10790 [Aridibacter sp.]
MDIMQKVETIYQQSILTLPNGEKLRLAAIILQDLSNAEQSKQSALDLLQDLPNTRIFSSSKDVDNYLKAERESWDN